MDNYHNILLEEYFNATTSESRRIEIRNELLKLNPDDPDRILLELGEEVEVEEKVHKLTSTIESIADNRRSNWVLKVAASIVFIMASVFIGIELNKTNASSDDLFNTYFLPYDGVIVSRDNSEGFDGIRLYNAKEYEEAIDIFKDEFETSNNPEIALLISSCYLSIDDPAQALSWLGQVDAVNQKLIDNKDWYMALTLMKMDQTTKAVALLREIIETNSPFKEKANELLSDLD